MSFEKYSVDVQVPLFYRRGSGVFKGVSILAPWPFSCRLAASISVQFSEKILEMLVHLVHSYDFYPSRHSCSLLFNLLDKILDFFIHFVWLLRSFTLKSKIDLSLRVIVPLPIHSGRILLRL